MIIMSKGAPGVRYAEIERESRGMRVSVVLDFDGGTVRDVSTGSPILDEWLRQFAFFGQFNLGLQMSADRPVHDHQLLTEIGLALGQAIRECLEETRDLERSASWTSPVEDALVLVALDLGNRTYFSWNLEPGREVIAELSAQSLRELFRAMADEGRFTLHVHQMSGSNANNLFESVFRGLGRALHEAAIQVDRTGETRARR